MKALIITNKSGNGVNPSLTNLFGTIKALAGNSNYPAKCDVVIAGHDLANVSQQIAGFDVVKQVLQIDSPALEHLFAENIAPQLANIVKNYTHVLVAADSFGKNLLPRIAGILELGQISEIMAVVSPNIFKKFTYAGNVLVEIESLEDIKLLTVRANNFDEVDTLAANSAPVSNIEYTGTISNKIKFISRDVVDKSVDLGSAKVVVTGGFSLTSKENFDENIRALADKLHAAVGASRAAVEAGFAPNDCQVGQTGTVVAPDVYLAIGVSGAVQHIAGMKDSKTVIAINTDDTAPIFEHAEYGIVGDLFELVPQLISKL